jgi:hypothetical protein
MILYFLKLSEYYIVGDYSVASNCVSILYGALIYGK